MNLPWWFPFGRVEEIAPRELREQLARDGHALQLIDVRSEIEFNQGHLAHARNVPINVLPRQLASLHLDPNRPVIAICLSGHRSVPAYRLLKRTGFRQVYSLAGGMVAWWSARLPTMKD
ncbi:MAG: rhodanese-like domain-containing protein [Chloroflexi bacterium]|nr:rhodanese-like domain-containing protein [Chloroflexota bacterium]